ncbi:MAG: hypothetical protein D4R81_06060 [Nitrospiraceae bacterium]|nr:MAG: hypothetical protein D4R81_06060 [Nitrospiraceae bacterium]
MATDGKKVRIRVRTAHAVYIGDILLPAMRNRMSDYFNDEKHTFFNLTNVRIQGTKDEMEFVCLNKTLIESIIPAD